MNFQPQDVTVNVSTRAKPALRRRRILLALISGAIVLAAAGFLLVEYFELFGTKGAAPILCTDPCELPHFSGMPDYAG
jgi:hypothetical protein